MKTIRLIFGFYRSYAFASLIITLVCIYFVAALGIKYFALLFWFKIITLGMMFYLVNSYKRSDFYFYKNLGLTKKTLWISTLSFDMVLYFTGLILTPYLKCIIPWNWMA